MINIAILLLGGIIYALGFPPLGLGIAHYLGLGLLAYVLFRYRYTNGQRLRMAWLFGFVAHCVGLYWVANAIGYVSSSVIAGYGAVVIGSLYLGVFFAIPAYLASRAKALPARMVLFYVLLLVGDWLRSYFFLPFPWNTFGHGWFFSDSLLQSASVFGSYGMGAVSLGTSFAAAYVLMRRKPKQAVRRFVPLVGFAVATCLLWSYGAVRLSAHASGTAEIAAPLPPSVTQAGGAAGGWHLRVVQPNISQQEKWVNANAQAHLKKQIQLSTAGLDPTRKTLIIWPEAATNYIDGALLQAMGQIRDAIPTGAYLGLGHLRRGSGNDAVNVSAAGSADRGTLRNSFTVIKPNKPSPSDVSDGGQTASALSPDLTFTLPYDKVNLVPFGEYTPLSRFLGLSVVATGNEMRAGSGPGVVVLDEQLIVAPLICYDAVFSGRIVGSAGVASGGLATQGGAVLSRPNLLVNVTNDAWYGNTWGPRQHAAYSRLRAIEEGIPLARSANTGISAVWDAVGTPLKVQDFDTTNVLDVALPRALHPTVYARVGFLPFFGWIALCLAYGWLLHRRGVRLAMLRRARRG
ncbi:MAG: apolipoprotein N-acyltransferase [Alphaproteobacteria bacterium]|nr:apolipoprotein N-acyltransferase [Alphaproteobacteria bacterium]